MSAKKKCRSKLYTDGEINRIIDSLIHPFYEENQWLRLIDGGVHAAVERDLKSSVKKFVKYNLRDILKEILEKR